MLTHPKNTEGASAAQPGLLNDTVDRSVQMKGQVNAGEWYTAALHEHQGLYMSSWIHILRKQAERLQDGIYKQGRSLELDVRDG